MRVFFVNRFFYPDVSATSQLVTDLALALAERGIGVTAITSRQLYDDETISLPQNETAGAITIVRVAATRFGRRTLAGRACDYLTFYLTAAFAVLRLVARGDVVVAKTDPPMLSVVLGPVAWLKGARLVNWLQDLFPEVAQELGIGAGSPVRLAYRALRAVRDLSLRRAAMNVAIGDAMAHRLGRCGVPADRLCVIENWADGALMSPVERSRNPLIAAWGLETDFVVAYSGNLGRAHDHQTILEAITRLEHSDGADCGPSVGPAVGRVRWLFIGGGSGMEALRRAAAARGLTSLMFQPYQPRATLAAALSIADVHLISLRPQMEGLIVPSKFYGIEAVGRPSIFIGAPDGEIAQKLAKSGAGVSVAEGDSSALACAVLAFARDRAAVGRMGANARRAFEEGGDKAAAVARWESLLAGVVSKSVPIPPQRVVVAPP